MRYVLIGWFLAATTSAALGQAILPHPVAVPVAPASAAATPSYERLEHLLRAAVHLEAAGLPQRADELWRQADDEKRALRARGNGLSIHQRAVPQPPTAVRQVMIHVKILEVPLGKLERLGPTFSQLTDGLISSGNLGSAMRMGVVGSDPGERSLLEALQKDKLVRVLATPTLVTLSGQPAHLEVGGQIPFPVPGHGEARLEQRFCGTRVDALPVVLPNGKIRLELRASMSELDRQRQLSVQGKTVPSLNERTVDTAVEMQSGQTVVLGGLNTRHKADQQAAKPEASTETQTLVLATAEIVQPMGAYEAAPRR